jgi:uncharacterized protein YoxC
MMMDKEELLFFFTNLIELSLHRGKLGPIKIHVGEIIVLHYFAVVSFMMFVKEQIENADLIQSKQDEFASLMVSLKSFKEKQASKECEEIIRDLQGVKAQIADLNQVKKQLCDQQEKLFETINQKADWPIGSNVQELQAALNFSREMQSKLSSITIEFLDLWSSCSQAQLILLGTLHHYDKHMIEARGQAESIAPVSKKTKGQEIRLLLSLILIAFL